MEHPRFIGLDIERISVAVAESGRSGAVEYLGEIANEPGAMSKLCDRLRRPGTPLAFCYEAGPCGYDIHRQLTRVASFPPGAAVSCASSGTTGNAIPLGVSFFPGSG